MKRYDLQQLTVEPATKITIGLHDLKNPTNIKTFSLYTGECVSFLYTENMEDVGKNDKIVRGKVIGVMQIPTYHVKQRRPTFGGSNQFDNACEHINSANLIKSKGDDLDHVILIIDESVEYNTKIGKYKLSGILDINRVDHVYLEDAPDQVDTSQGLSVTQKSEGEQVYVHKEVIDDTDSSGKSYIISPSSYSSSPSAKLSSVTQASVAAAAEICEKDNGCFTVDGVANNSTPKMVGGVMTF